MEIEAFSIAIQDEVNLFEDISLGEMDKVKLMDRVDIKYLIPLCLLPQILAEARNNYHVLEINQERICAYETQYFDEAELSLYQRHQAGFLNRYKVRTRNYVGSNLQFFEVKIKNNKGRTLKKRIRTELHQQAFIKRNELDFLEKHSPFSTQSLKGVLSVYYKRITLVSKHHIERLTIDVELSFQHQAHRKCFPKIVIAEVKQERKGASDFVKIMKKFHIRQGSISKYCFGIISLFDNIKQNRFKPHLLKITKIIKQHDHFATNYQP
jgi:VTC domain